VLSLRNDFDRTMIVTMVAVGMMEMAVVKIVDVAAVFDGGMAAVRAVLVTVVGMGFWIAHNLDELG
jgi:hypothetical protein